MSKALRVKRSVYLHSLNFSYNSLAVENHSPKLGSWQLI